MEIREVLQNQHDFFLVSYVQFFDKSKKLAQAQKVNKDGAALCGFANYRFLKEIDSYIDLPFGEWGQNYGDFILDARG